MPVSHTASEHCKRQLLERVSNDIPALVKQALQNAPAGRQHPDHPLVTRLVSETQRSQAQLISHQDGIFCGKAWAETVLQQMSPDITLQWHTSDAGAIHQGQILATLSGPASVLLSAETTLLHFLQTLSGISTRFSHSLSQLAETSFRVIDSLNTQPGVSNAVKYARLCGDHTTQRLDLSDLIPINENHIIACGSVVSAIENARWIDPDRPVEVTVTSLTQFSQALVAGADLILLHNFTLPEINAAVAERHRQQVLPMLVIGGQNACQHLPALSQTGADYLAASALLSRPQPLDISLQFLPVSA
ncbi:carboxylating nicotinate-nucleotide diphosphorylase [Tatumella terrea]|uniref:nicotinate-nucleotide diphosphorylase n=1 Tax=Tatumella terrea TaxID=419007 RepID=UPI0031D8367F